MREPYPLGWGRAIFEAHTVYGAAGGADGLLRLANACHAGVMAGATTTTMSPPPAYVRDGCMSTAESTIEEPIRSANPAHSTSVTLVVRASTPSDDESCPYFHAVLDRWQTGRLTDGIARSSA
jgi:hypothetical protein